MKRNPVYNENIWIWRVTLKDIRIVHMWWFWNHVFYVNSFLNDPFTIYYYEGNTHWKISHSACFRLVFWFRTFIWQLICQDCFYNINVKEAEMATTRKLEVLDCDFDLKWECYCQEVRTIQVWWFYRWTFFTINLLKT